MASKSEIVNSLKKQGLVTDPETWMKLAALIACVSVKMGKGEALDAAVYSCFQEVR
ncbi:MAG: hypothetical protein WCK96_04310 [Methylococcales bacterium]